MEKLCVICSKKAEKFDANNESYCNEHFYYSKKNEKINRKKTKRVLLSDEEYWDAVREGSFSNMDPSSFISSLIRNAIVERNRKLLKY